MKQRNIFTIITMVILLFSMVSNTYVTTGISTTPGNGATISNVSMTDNNQQSGDGDPTLMKESYEMIENERQLTKGAMNYHEIRASLDSIYEQQGTNLYNEGQSKYDSSVKQLNQIIVTFTTMEERELFVSKISEPNLVKEFNFIPSVVVINNQEVRDLLLNTRTITDIMGDIIFELPQYEVGDKDDMETAHYNSESRIGAPLLHDLGYTGEGVKVSVLDTGIDSTHHDLALTTDGLPKVIAAQSFVPGEGTSDQIGHGTHVAGTVAGNGDHIGVAPGAQLLNAKVCSFAGCATSWMVEAIEWSISQDVDIITMSIGGSTFFGLDPLDHIIDYAWQNGITLTIAAGNAGPSFSTVSTPGTGPRVLTVGATDTYDKVTYFSGRGPSVFGEFDPDIAAPGSGVFSTLPGDTYGIYDGTSMATPHVAGAAALLLEAHPRSTNNELKANLMSNAKDMEGFGSNIQGAGLVDLMTTHQNWNRRRSVVFPMLTEDDTFYMTPGESYTGIISFVRGSLGLVPTFNLDSGTQFVVDIDKSALQPFEVGHQFIPFTITVPNDATVGETLERTIKVSYFPYQMQHLNKIFPDEEMKVVVQVVENENDGFLGYDASDTFIGATEVPLSSFEGFANDIDFYKVELEEGKTYQITLSGMTGISDFDLGVYNEDGELTCDSCNIFFGGTSPEFVVLTAAYSGYHYIRVDPWSVLYINPFTTLDTSGPYQLTIEEGSELPPEPSGTQFDFIEAVVYGQDADIDGIYEGLVVEVTVDVISTGFLDAYAFLTLDKGGPLQKWYFATAFIEFHEFTTTGVQSFTMFLDGMNFADQDYNGPVVIYELFMGDPSTFTILYDLFNVYTSPAINSADFGPTHMTYNYLNSQPVDENGDGVGDYLEVVVSVDISTTFSWYSLFDATLFHPDGYYIYNQNFAEVDLSTSGEALLYFIFDPDAFVSGETDPFDLELIITYSFDHPLSTETLHFGTFPYILTIGDIVPVDPADYGGSTSTAEILGATDYGMDTDSDGTFDYLVIDVSVFVGQAGFYSLTFHPWLWSVTDQEVLFDFESDPFLSIQWLEEGEQALTMTINGELIEAMEIDLPLMILAIWLDYWEEAPWGMQYVSTPDTLQNYKTASYLSSDFDQSGANFLGISGVNYVDLSGDGQAETVELLLDIDVGYVGEFYFFMFFINYPILGAFYADFVDNYYFFDQTGVQTVSFYIDGTQLYRQEYTGYIEIWEMDIFSGNDFSFTYFDFQNGLFWVDYTQLPGAAPPGQLVSITDYGLDANNNGLYEGVVIDVTIDVNREAYFFMLMDVFGGENFFDYVGFYFNDFYIAEAGTYVISMFIPGSDILNNVFAESSSFEIWLYLYEDFTGFNDRLGPEYTSSYDLNMFEKDAAITSISDQGVDENSNGLFEKLEVTVTIDVNTPGDYYLDMESYVGVNGEFLGFSSEYFFASDPGTYIVQLYISGTNIVAQLGVDFTDFELYLFLWNFNGLADSVFGYYTDVYAIADFEYSALMTSFNDFAVDNNGNGLYEGINIEITVDVVVEGFYSVDLEVYSAGNFNWIGYFSYGLFAETPGVYTVNILIDAASIIANAGVDPTEFELFIYLYGDTGLLQIENYLTGIYDPSMFETSAEVTNISDFGLDEDANGQFEFIVISITIEVNVADTYNLRLDMFGNDDQNYSEFVVGYRNSYDLDVNTHTLEILLPTTLIVSRLSDDFTNFLTFIVIEDSGFNQIAFVEYLTDYYSVDDLEFIVNVLNTNHFGNDTDNDGLFETFVIEFEMEFFKTGDYALAIYLYGDADMGGTFIGYYEKGFSVSAPGIYTISIAVPAADILSVPLDENTNFYYFGAILDATPYVVTISGPYFTDYYSLSDFDTI